MQDLISIVIINYKSEHLIRPLLNTLNGLNIVVVNNSAPQENPFSSDSTVEWINSPGNIGFGRAANLGIRNVTTPYALLINPDVAASTENIRRLLERRPNDESSWLLLAPNTGENVSRLPGKDSPPTLITIKHASGCALLFNVKTFHELGGFDENIFLFFEETDLCQRALTRRYNMYYAEDIYFPHATGTSVKGSEAINRLKNWHYHWSRLYFLKKRGKFIALGLILFKCLVTYPIKILLSKNKKKLEVYRMRRSASKFFICGKGAFESSNTPYLPK